MKVWTKAIVFLLAASMALPWSGIGSATAERSSALFSPGQIRQAFEESHDGYSSDELIVDEKLRLEFLRKLGIDASSPGTNELQTHAALALFKLRKTGKLDVTTTRSRREDLSAVTETAEIAIRTVVDRHHASIDQILCDPALRRELQREAEKITPAVDARLVRKAVLRLRKIRRLRPELVLRVAQWQTEVKTMPISDLDFNQIPESPGVYLFRSQEGYLYIGEAVDLRERLSQHWSGTHNEGLAGVLAGESSRVDSITLELHVFASESPGRQAAMRRAYESELIRSRQPKFNLRP